MRFPRRRKSILKPGTSDSGKIAKKKTVNIYVRADKEYVKSARKYAKEQKLSLSALVENYFRVIHERTKLPSLELPAAKSLRGILKDMQRSRAGYYIYLEEKYK